MEVSEDPGCAVLLDDPTVSALDESIELCISRFDRANDFPKASLSVEFAQK